MSGRAHVTCEHNLIEFIAMLSAEALTVAEKDKRSVIAGRHVVAALKVSTR